MKVIYTVSFHADGHEFLKRFTDFNTADGLLICDVLFKDEGITGGADMGKTDERGFYSTVRVNRGKCGAWESGDLWWRGECSVCEADDTPRTGKEAGNGIRDCFSVNGKVWIHA